MQYVLDTHHYICKQTQITKLDIYVFISNDHFL
jgi:hypothetical protein